MYTMLEIMCLNNTIRENKHRIIKGPWLQDNATKDAQP